MNEEEKIDDDKQRVLLSLTTDIVSAFVGNNSLGVDQLPHVIDSVYKTLGSLGDGPSLMSKKPKPAIAIKKSVTDDYIVCLEDGRKLKMLKRYLRTQYDMTPEDYRAKWGLPADYPMVAPNYAKKRSAFAKEIGLGKSRKK